MNFFDWSSLFRWESPQQGGFNLHPNWPRWLVWVWWNTVRNPWISGVIRRVDKPIITIPADAGTWNPDGGWWKVTVIGTIQGAAASRPFISYRGKLIEGYAGWRPNGGFGLALRHANAKPVVGPHVS